MQAGFAHGVTEVANSVYPTTVLPSTTHPPSVASLLLLRPTLAHSPQRLDQVYI